MICLFFVWTLNNERVRPITFDWIDACLAASEHDGTRL